jgi:hypothetical protein
MLLSGHILIITECLLYLNGTSHVRQRLKSAIDIATASQDNHLRAIAMALTAAHYVHTASDVARKILDTTRQLSSGMGAPASKSGTTMDLGTLGNAPLGLWVGERFQGVYHMTRLVIDAPIDLAPLLLPSLYSSWSRTVRPSRRCRDGAKAGAGERCISSSRPCASFANSVATVLAAVQSDLVDNAHGLLPINRNC